MVPFFPNMQQCWKVFLHHSTAWMQRCLSMVKEEGSSLFLIALCCVRMQEDLMPFSMIVFLMLLLSAATS